MMRDPIVYAYSDRPASAFLGVDGDLEMVTWGDRGWCGGGRPLGPPEPGSRTGCTSAVLNLERYRRGDCVSGLSHSHVSGFRQEGTYMCVCVHMYVLYNGMSLRGGCADAATLWRLREPKVLRGFCFSRCACNATAPRSLTACLSGAATALRRLWKPRGQARLLRHVFVYLYKCLDG